MRRFVAVLLWALCVGSALAHAQDFALRDGDVVVFYGDSITAQRLYTVYTETAVHALHPEWKIRFFNAGVGGDKVTGGIAGYIDERLDRDVFSRRPTVITIMLGMNDRGADDAAYQAYIRGYRHILERLRQEAPQTRVMLIGPSPLDDMTRLFNGGNQPLVRYSEAVRSLASEFKAGYVDFNRPVADALRSAHRQNPDGSELLIPDRVHPQEAVHMVMAQALLGAWHFPEYLADVSLDFKDISSTHVTGSIVSAVRKVNDVEFEWTESDAPDIVAFQPEDGSLLWWRKIDPHQQLGIRRLQVRSLPPDEKYTLEVDGKMVRQTMTAHALDQGIDLSGADTPMHAAARSVYYACADSEINQVVRNRVFGSNDAALRDNPMREEGERFLDAVITASQQKIDAASARTTHHYRLLRATAAAPASSHP